MRKIAIFAAVGLFAGVAVALRTARSDTPATAAQGPQFTADGKLVRPEGYRRWAYVSSGLGMSYTAGPGGYVAPMFTNVFVNPAAYEYYQAHGTWPEQTMFVLEIYGSTSHGSINKDGRYQDGFMGVEAEVKDSKRFPDKWAYFGFDNGQKTAAAMSPSQNACWTCHEQNAAVEHSFVQFYPELLKLAYDKGTIKPTVHLTPSAGRVGELIAEQGWAKFEPQFDEAKHRDPDAETFKEKAATDIAMQVWMTGKREDAIAFLLRAAKDFPESAMIAEGLGDGYFDLGDKAKSQEYTQKALELLPKDAAMSADLKAQIERSAKERLTRLKEQK